MDKEKEKGAEGSTFFHTATREGSWEERDWTPYFADIELSEPKEGEKIKRKSIFRNQT